MRNTTLFGVILTITTTFIHNPDVVDAFVPVVSVPKLVVSTSRSTTTSIVEPATKTSTELAFGIPSFLLPKNDDDNNNDNNKTPVKNNKNSQKGKKGSVIVDEKNKNKITAKGILQLITAGAGAPFLGDFEGVDKETGKFMFSLEANNLVDEKGNSKQTQMPYFENGWIDEEEEAKNKNKKWPWEK